MIHQPNLAVPAGRNTPAPAWPASAGWSRGAPSSFEHSRPPAGAGQPGGRGATVRPRYGKAMSQETGKAILAGGSFWGMQDRIRKRPGVLSSRVGYTGGDVQSATYYHHGPHAGPGHRDHLRPGPDVVPGTARVLLPDPRPDDEESAGQRHRRQLPVGHL